ncbi:hypothetical protein ACFYNX_20940 [Streptomyces sp. NPDC007872]|uniref:hypothetical protein n=1 Tax=Streptomyces sp. NPDC007872 TaxID=3364782 RepID=UPI0036AF7467
MEKLRTPARPAMGHLFRTAEDVVPPSPDEVFAYAASQVERAACGLWPGAEVRLGPTVPSVTSYVRRVEVDGRPLYAKLSVLGVSLVSLLRGSCGDWGTVLDAQAAYVASPGSLLEREARQLAVLAGPAALHVPTVAGYEGGVLFTEPVHGPTLAELLARAPHRTAVLLETVIGEMAVGLRRRGVAARVGRSEIRERSITGTFLRKFNGLSGSTCLRQTCHAEALAAVVGRLHQARRITASPARAVVFGDLKPEHVVFPDGAERPAFLDPGLMRGRPADDAAKLVSRTVLNLVARPPGTEGVRALLGGVAAYAASATVGSDRSGRDAWLRQLTLLWLMDTANILTTYLTAPADLPLTAHAADVVRRARAVCDMLDRSTAAVVSYRDARGVWRLCLDSAAKTAAS